MGPNGRVPPHDLEAEAAVLSAVLLDGAALGKLAFLEPAHFYSESHNRIFEAARDLVQSGKSVDVVQVATWLKDRGRIAQVGGFPYLTQVLNAAPAVANVANYGRTVLEKARIRQIIAECQRIEAEGYLDYGDADTWVARNVDRLQELAVPVRGGLPWVDAASLAEPLPVLSYLVRELGLVAGGGAPHLVAGYGFSGKTAALQAMLLALAAGRAVWGAYSVPQPFRVTHVDLPGEQGKALSQRRYQRIARSMGVDLAEINRGDGHLRLLSEYPLTLLPASAPQWREAMAGMDVILVDSLRAASPGQDENSSEFRGGLDMLSDISAKTGCRAIVIHHARKKSKDDPGGAQIIRGSSGIFDACDSVYVFRGEKNEPTECEHVKARSHGELVPDWALTIADEEFDGNVREGLRIAVHGAELVKEIRKKKTEDRRKVDLKADVETLKSVLRSSPGITARALRASAQLRGLSARRTESAVQSLIETQELTASEEVQGEGRGRSVVLKHYLRERN